MRGKNWAIEIDQYGPVKRMALWANQGNGRMVKVINERFAQSGFQFN